MNLYFEMLANSDNEADAIAEAKRLAGHHRGDVAVHHCGTRHKICAVSEDGRVFFPEKRSKSQDAT